MLLELIGKCTSCLLCTPAIEQRVRGNQRVNQGPSERQWDCGRGSCRGHRMGLGRINWNALFRMVYSVLVEWNASSLTRAMAGGAGCMAGLRAMAGGAGLRPAMAGGAGFTEQRVQAIRSTRRALGRSMHLREPA